MEAVASSFVSYGLLLLIFVVLGGLADAVGISLRKRKDAKGSFTIEKKEISEE